jgi:putative DNA primase/helicase
MRGEGTAAGPWQGATAGEDRAEDGAAEPRRHGSGSALPDWAFGRLAPELERRGFQSLPIGLPDPNDPDAGKKPPGSLARWQVPTAVAAWLPRYAHCGVGLLTATTPAVDNDVRHAEVAEAIDRAVVEEAGDAPVRFGAAPKRLRLYRAEAPFRKLATAGYRLPGDEPGAKPHKVEVLAAGQQFVAFGVHPGTGRPYFWPFDSPLDLERDDLPGLTAERAARIIAAAEEILARVGTLAGSPTRQAPPKVERRPGPAPRPVRDLAEARRVLATLKSIDPSGLDYDTWVDTAYGTKAALGDHGRGPWIAWSRRSARHDGSDTPERVWKSARPTRCGWKFLERLAGEIGHGR